MPGGGSDLTLKKNILPLDDTLAKVLALQPVSWQWKTDNDNAPFKYGFIAQDVEHIMPELVTEGLWEDGTTRKFLNMEGMTPYLVSAIKQQQAQIEKLKQALVAQESGHTPT